MMEKINILKLLAKNHSGIISAAETSRMEAFLAEDKEAGKVAELLNGYLEGNRTQENPAKRIEDIWERIGSMDKNHPELLFDDGHKKRQMFFHSFLFRTAAILCVILSCSLVTLYLLSRSSVNRFTSLTSTGNKTFRVLDDGTKIWLNRYSSIRFNENFGESKREVFLEGEAYFDVAKNASVPMVIHAGPVEVKVKGTAFNMEAYRSRGTLNIFLDHGLIEVSNGTGSESTVLLRPKERLRLVMKYLENKHSGFLIETVSSQALRSASQWTSDTLSFNNEKLKDLRFRLEKKYLVKIEIQSEKLAERRFSGAFIDETLQQALEGLKLAYPFKYVIQAKTVKISD